MIQGFEKVEDSMEITIEKSKNRRTEIQAVTELLVKSK